MTITPATSGTYTYAATTAEVVLEAYERLGLMASALETDHMISARRSLNILLTSDWPNRGPNLWAVELVDIPLVEGTATYSLDERTVALLDVYIRTNSGQSDQVDRLLYPISRTDYAATPNKTQEAPPTVFYFNRQESPDVTFWATPDGNGPYIVRAYRLRIMQDSNVSLGELPDVPNRFVEALCANLALKLAVKWKPAAVPLLKTQSDEAWLLAAREDRERVTIYAGPDLSNYYRLR